MILTVLNLISVIVIPIVAVLIGQYLQNRAEKRKDKLEIFKTLMMSRPGWTEQSVRAMNIIDVIFSEDKAVRTAWKEYYDLLCIQSPNTQQQVQIQSAQYELLESMAVALGYKGKITWEDIQSPYMPIGMVNAMRQQQIIQNGQEIFAASMPHILNTIQSSPTNKASENSQE